MDGDDWSSGRDVDGKEGPKPGAAEPRPPADNECTDGGDQDWRARCRAAVRRVGWGQVVVTAIITALLVLLAMPAIFGVNPYDLVRGRVRSNATSGQATRVTVISPSSGSENVSTVAKNVTGSIVNIDTRTAPPQPTTTATPTIGSGSGIIYRENGLIITNNHLVGTADTITVTLGNGRQYDGARVGTNPATDIAVIKIDATGLPPVALGNSDNLVVGQLVIAVGSPLGFQQTVTSGIISALNRSVGAIDESGKTLQLDGLIQTDAPINPGNSGGALCDAYSKLIGINAVIASQTGGSEGIAFAIPVNAAVKAADGIIAGR